MNRSTKKSLLISGIALGIVAALIIPGKMLYKKVKARKQQSENGHDDDEEHTRHFASSYLGRHKPHHRKARVNRHSNHKNH